MCVYCGCGTWAGMCSINLLLPLIFARVTHSCVCVCIVGVVLGRGCVVLTDAGPRNFPPFRGPASSQLYIFGKKKLLRSLQLLPLATFVCVCVYCGCGTWAGMRSIN